MWDEKTEWKSTEEQNIILGTLQGSSGRVNISYEIIYIKEKNEEKPRENNKEK